MRRLLLAAVLVVRAAAAHGHAFDPAVLDLRERAAGGWDVAWKPPLGTERLLTPVLPPACRPLSEPFARVGCDLAGAVVGVDGLETGRREAIVRVGFADGRETTAVLRGAAARLVVPRAPDAAALAWSYGRLGVAHILGGADHLLFVLALLLLVPGAAALVRAVTAFTVGHSLTLALAVGGIARVPPATVEILIAASIVVVALEALRPAARPTALATRPWLAAGGFGLLHGLGFAGALAAAGLPPGRAPLALFAFNAGVEAGQLAVLAVAALPAALLARRPAWRAVPAYAIGAVAARWTLERLGGLL